MNTKRILETISQTISALEKLHHELASGDKAKKPKPSTDPIARMVQEKIDAKICLMCDEPIEPSESSRRGVHNRCYTRHRESVLAGEVTDKAAIAKGLIAPPKKGGRPKVKTKADQKLDELRKDKLRDELQILDPAPE